MPQLVIVCCYVLPPNPDTGDAEELNAMAEKWLVFAIGTTLCCCPPLGIIGIFYAARARDAAGRGDIALASRQVASTRVWTIRAFFSGLVLIPVGWMLAEFLQT